MGIHGKFSTYTRGGCRCDDCRDAARLYARDIRRRRRSGELPEGMHGTGDGYRNWSCRCDLCRKAQAADIRAYRAKKKSVEPMR